MLAEHTLCTMGLFDDPVETCGRAGHTQNAVAGVEPRAGYVLLEKKNYPQISLRLVGL